MLSWYASILTLGLNLPADSFATCVTVSLGAISSLRIPGTAYQCFGLLDVLGSEEELAIEIAEVNRVEVDNVDLTEAGQDEVFEQFAADTAGTNHEHTRL